MDTPSPSTVTAPGRSRYQAIKPKTSQPGIRLPEVVESDVIKVMRMRKVAVESGGQRRGHSWGQGKGQGNGQSMVQDKAEGNGQSWSQSRVGGNDQGGGQGKDQGGDLGKGQSDDLGEGHTEDLGESQCDLGKGQGDLGEGKGHGEDLVEGKGKDQGETQDKCQSEAQGKNEGEAQGNGQSEAQSTGQGKGQGWGEDEAQRDSQHEGHDKPSHVKIRAILSQKPQSLKSSAAETVSGSGDQTSQSSAIITSLGGRHILSHNVEIHKVVSKSLNDSRQELTTEIDSMLSNESCITKQSASQDNEKMVKYPELQAEINKILNVMTEEKMQENSEGEERGDEDYVEEHIRVKNKEISDEEVITISEHSKKRLHPRGIQKGNAAWRSRKGGKFAKEKKPSKPSNEGIPECTVKKGCGRPRGKPNKKKDALPVSESGERRYGTRGKRIVLPTSMVPGRFALKRKLDEMCGEKNDVTTSEGSHSTEVTPSGENDEPVEGVDGREVEEDHQDGIIEKKEDTENDIEEEEPDDVDVRQILSLLIFVVL